MSLIFYKEQCLDSNHLPENDNHFQVDSFFSDCLQFIKDWQRDKVDFKLQTSGSTGVPKKIHTTRNLLEYSAQNTINFFQIPKGGHILVNMNPLFIAAQMQLIRGLINQMNIYLCPPQINPNSWYPSIHFNFVAISPLQLEKWLQQATDFSRYSTIILGGASVSASLNSRITAIKSTDFFETYGMTETLSHIAVRNCKTEEYFKVIHPDLEISKTPEGCLQINGYITNNQIITTNDLIELSPNHTFKILGRKDFIINSGGIKINPVAIEAEIKNVYHSNLVVIGITDELLGEKAILVTDEINCENWQFEFLEKYYRPKSVYYLSELPLTNSGKIDRLNVKKIVISKYKI